MNSTNDMGLGHIYERVILIGQSRVETAFIAVEGKDTGILSHFPLKETKTTVKSILSMYVLFLSPHLYFPFHDRTLTSPVLEWDGRETQHLTYTHQA